MYGLNFGEIKDSCKTKQKKIMQCIQKPGSVPVFIIIVTVKIYIYFYTIICN